MSRKNKLYTTLFIANIAGYTYFIYSLITINKQHELSLCIIKNSIGIPCPSCGSTRAIQLIFQNKWIDSLAMNPFGIVVAVLMIVIPTWIFFDVVFKKETFFKWYKKMEVIIRKPWLASILILVVLLNWIWNIYKNL